MSFKETLHEIDPIVENVCKECLKKCVPSIVCMRFIFKI